MKRKGRITRIERENTTSCNVTQGIKRGEQKYYDNAPGYVGGNGTYYHDFVTDPHIYLYLTLYETKDHEEERVKIDIRDSILEKNGLKRVSAQRLKNIQENNVSKKVSVEWNPNNGTVTFDDQLVL